jgi:hypothetical protein
VSIEGCCRPLSLILDRITFEWALIAGENDKPNTAHELGRLLSRLRGLCHVNLSKSRPHVRPTSPQPPLPIPVSRAAGPDIHSLSPRVSICLLRCSPRQSYLRYASALALA